MNETKRSRHQKVRAMLNSILAYKVRLLNLVEDFKFRLCITKKCGLGSDDL